MININGVIEEFVSYKVPSWSFFSKFKIFKEGFFNILDEVFVSRFVVVRPLESLGVFESLRVV
jgi:hypothetical protein